jgi:hypothetical protein
MLKPFDFLSGQPPLEALLQAFWVGLMQALPPQQKTA